MIELVGSPTLAFVIIFTLPLFCFCFCFTFHRFKVQLQCPTLDISIYTFPNEQLYEISGKNSIVVQLRHLYHVLDVVAEFRQGSDCLSYHF